MYSRAWVFQLQKGSALEPHQFSYQYILTSYGSLYRPPNIFRAIKSRRLKWVGHVARMEEGRSPFEILTGKPTAKRPLGRPKRRWEDNIRMDCK